MSNFDQAKPIDPIRELTMDEVQAVSGGDGGGPPPVDCGCDAAPDCGCGICVNPKK